MKRWIFLGALLGLGAATALIVKNNAASIAAMIAGQGWGVLLVTLFHFGPLVLSAAALRALGAKEPRPPGMVFLGARILREAVNDLLPAAQVGGAAAAARLLTKKGWALTPTLAALFADVTLESASQVVFVVLGVVVLLADGRAPGIALPALAGAGLLAAGVVGFLLLQQAGVLAFIARQIRKFAADFAGESGTAALETRTGVLYRDPKALAAGFGLHLACWIVGTAEVWLILHFMGVSCSWAEAFILESLGTAVRSAAFMIPAGLGVQEGGYLVLGSALGLGAPVALALSLTKRVREILIGVPALILWQLAEGRRMCRGARDQSSL